MTTHNGHKNWNHWNVSLWISNDEGLYRLALQHLRSCVGRRHAAQSFLSDLREVGTEKTPDGAPYTLTTVMAAFRGLSEDVAGGK